MRTMRFVFGFPFLLLGCLLACVGASIMHEQEVDTFLREVFDPKTM